MSLDIYATVTFNHISLFFVCVVIYLSDGFQMYPVADTQGVGQY